MVSLSRENLDDHSAMSESGYGRALARLDPAVMWESVYGRAFARLHPRGDVESDTGARLPRTSHPVLRGCGYELCPVGGVRSGPVRCGMSPDLFRPPRLVASASGIKMVACCSCFRFRGSRWWAVLLLRLRGQDGGRREVAVLRDRVNRLRLSGWSVSGSGGCR